MSHVGSALNSVSEINEEVSEATIQNELGTRARMSVQIKEKMKAKQDPEMTVLKEQC